MDSCSYSLTCSEYDVARNERAMFSTTSVGIRKLYNVDDDEARFRSAKAESREESKSRRGEG